MTNIKEYEDNMYFEYDGKKIFVEENGLDYLLEYHNDYFFFLPGKLIDRDGNNHDCMFVAINCSDLFWWACSDIEIFGYDEIESVYKAAKSGKWGISKWVCKKRKMRPQHPIEEDMKKDGQWDDEMELLSIRENTG